MGDSGLVLTCITWLVVTVVLLGLAGFGDQSGNLKHPQDPSQTQVSGAHGTTSANAVQNFICSVFLTPLSVINFGSGSLCNYLAGAAAIVYDTVDHLVTALVNFFSILFQLNTLGLPKVPGFLQAMIVWPPEFTLGYIGLKGFRGTGG